MIQYNLFDTVRAGGSAAGPLMQAGPRGRLFGRPVCSPFLAKPCGFVSGSKIFTQFPAGICNFAGGRAGRFAPRSSLGLMPPFRGAKSSHNSRPEYAISPATGRPVCSPLLAKPCGFVPGSKIFTQFPRPRPVPADFSKARFAPLCPPALVAPFRGAKSSHNSRPENAVSPAIWPAGLLPAPR